MNYHSSGNSQDAGFNMQSRKGAENIKNYTGILQVVYFEWSSELTLHYLKTPRTSAYIKPN